MTPRPKARCGACNRTYQKHSCGERRLCPDGSARSFVHRTPLMRAATSFDAREVEWLATLLTGIEQRGDLRLLARKPECALIARKVKSMRAALPREGRT